MSCLAITARRPKLSVKILQVLVSLEQRYSVVAPVSQRVQEGQQPGYQTCG